ncbi:MAG: hypothetical protein JW816_01640 [Candidatus Buchananbacteria bacterium]|nr:hypothetical protein [Candidatus Buchananbacteria bacterium]
MAARFHNGQQRDDGSDALSHPISCCQVLLCMKIGRFRNGKKLSKKKYRKVIDQIAAALLLHDVLEDTKATKKLLKKYFSRRVVGLVCILSRRPGESDEQYFARIRKDQDAIVAKVVDRACVVSDMCLCFTTERLQRQIDETNKHILSMIKHAKDLYQQYSDLLVTLEFRIRENLRSAEALIAEKKKVAEFEPQLKAGRRASRRKQ